MNNFTGLGISKIYTIVHKEETDNFNFTSHQRPFDGFILITKGKGTVTDEYGGEYSVREGDLILVRKGDRYEFHFPSPCSYITSGYDLFFDGDDFPVSIPYIIKCSENQVDTIKEICNIWQSHSWDSYTKCRIMILKFYMDILKKELKKNSYDTITNKAKEFISENFKRNFSGEEVAKYCNMSLSYLRSKFLKETGYTINGYRDFLRIKHAKELIISGCFSISEIASELGYCDVFHFSKIFKKVTGYSPRYYLKKNNGI